LPVGDPPAMVRPARCTGIRRTCACPEDYLEAGENSIYGRTRVRIFSLQLQPSYPVFAGPTRALSADARGPLRRPVPVSVSHAPRGQQSCYLLFTGSVFPGYLLKPFDIEGLKRLSADALEVNRLIKEIVGLPGSVTNILPPWTTWRTQSGNRFTGMFFRSSESSSARRSHVLPVPTQDSLLSVGQLSQAGLEPARFPTRGFHYSVSS